MVCFSPKKKNHFDILGLDSKDVAAEDAMAYFRWRHGSERARPVKKLFLPFKEWLKGDIDISYHSRRLCFPWGLLTVGKH